MATAESGLDRTEVYDEPAPTPDSVGLLQLSPSDAKNYAFPTAIKSQEDLKDPILNLQLGVWIMGCLAKKHPTENIYQCWGRYWSVLRWDKYWPGKKQDGFKRFQTALGVLEKEAAPPALPKSTISKADLQEALVKKWESFSFVRETKGPNRSPDIDVVNKWVGVDLGSPYCIAFLLYCLNQVCLELKLKNPVGKHAGTQEFFNNAPAKYKHLLTEDWVLASIAIMVQRNDSSHGHAVGVKVGRAARDSQVSTDEFNTGPDGGRDGEGFYHHVRSLAGTSSLKFRGAIDVCQWVIDAQ
jgi:hypothetical protein